MTNKLDEQAAADYERKLDLLRDELASMKEELEEAHENARAFARRAMLGGMKAIVIAVGHSSLENDRQLQYFNVDEMVRQAEVGEVDAWGAYEEWLAAYDLSGTGW
jgi:hypothetical protein